MVDTSDIITWTFIGFAILLLLAGIGTFLYIYIRESSIPTSPPYAPEKDFDSSIPIPSSLVGVANMPIPKSTPVPWCIPTYYAVRFVDPETGKYGSLGKWNPNPAVATPNPNHTHMKTSTCGANVVILYYSPNAQDSNNMTKYVLNVHRQVGNLDTTKEGEPINQIFRMSYSAQDGTQIHYGCPDTDNPASDQNCPADNNGCPNN